MNRVTALESKCYKQNYLTEVIAKVDFFSPEESIKKKLPQNIVDVAKTKFPLAEPQNIVANELKFSKSGQQVIQHEQTHWHFHGADREKKLVITPESAFIVYTKFEKYSQLQQEFNDICDVLGSTFPELGVKRLGLRYVNNIRSGETNPLEWGDYINRDLIRMFKFNNMQKSLTRLMNIVEYRIDDVNVRFQFGMHNPDYPSLIKQKIFVLDLDGYSNEFRPLVGITEYLDELHKPIQTMFEKSITAKFREHLDA